MSAILCAAAFFIAYLCGFLWYMGNCYWIRDTMSHYGDMPPLAPTLLLVGFSLVLGLYFGLFGLGIVLVRRATGSTRLALAVAPFLWTALELAAARITSVPWDQLGYSQVDNQLINQLAPWTGVYGISFRARRSECAPGRRFVAGARNQEPALRPLGMDRLRSLAADFRIRRRLCCAAQARAHRNRRSDPAQSGRGLARITGKGPEWDRHIAEFTRLAGEQCKTYIAGIPQTGAPTGEIICPPYPTHPDLVAWPESPAPSSASRPPLQDRPCSERRHAPSTRRWSSAASAWTLCVPLRRTTWNYYNSALVVGADGERVGRYDKIHLVPFGEYIPFQNLLTFAHKLTGRVGSVHSRHGAQRVSAAHAERRQPSLRRLHLL